MAQVVVGRIVRPHGVRGEVIVEVRTDDPEIRFQPGAEYDTPAGKLRAETVRWHQGRPMLFLAGVVGREAADALRGTELTVEIDPEQVEVGEDEFHDTQLVGMNVIEVGAEEPIGTVSRIDHGPHYETLHVKRRGTHPAMIPFVDEMIADVDLETRTITVDLPEGLLEL